MKVYTNREINNSDEGIIYIDPDGSYRIIGIETKPRGSMGNYLSVGKFKKEIDSFGDSKNIWTHYEYPNNFSMEGFECKREYEGSSAGQRIKWSFIVPVKFLQEGFGIAKIGSGEGGRGYRSTDIDVFFDDDRIERNTDVIVA